RARAYRRYRAIAGAGRGGRPSAESCPSACFAAILSHSELLRGEARDMRRRTLLLWSTVALTGCGGGSRDATGGPVLSGTRVAVAAPGKDGEWTMPARDYASSRY